MNIKMSKSNMHAAQTIDKEMREAVLKELGFVRTHGRGSLHLNVVISGALADSLADLILQAYLKLKVIEPDSKFSRSAFLKECVRHYVDSMQTKASSIK